WDDRVPEEVNRRIVDHCSDVLMPYTERSRANLLREGFAPQRIFVIGNPIAEVIDANAASIEASTILEELQVKRAEYFVASLHRAENIDNPARAQRLLHAMSLVARQYEMPVIVSVHPRLRSRIENFDLASEPLLRLMPPFGF